MIKKSQLLAVLILASLGIGCSSDDGDQNSGFDSSEYIYFISGKVNGESFFYNRQAYLFLIQDLLNGSS